MPKGESAKRCNRCKIVKSAKEFSKATRRKDGLQSFCKECSALYGKEYYREYGKRMRQQSNSALKKRLKRNKQWLKNYLEEHTCSDCETEDIRVLEFDHVRGVKKNYVSRLVLDGYSIKCIEDEIAKCDLVCANCHRIRTFDRSGGNYKTV